MVVKKKCLNPEEKSHSYLFGLAVLDRVSIYCVYYTTIFTISSQSLPSSSPSLVGWITISWNPSPAFSMGTCCLSKKPLELLSLLKTIGGKLKLGFLPKLLIAGKNPFELSFWTFSLFAY